jgi:hypothetical protein
MHKRLPPTSLLFSSMLSLAALGAATAAPPLEDSRAGHPVEIPQEPGFRCVEAPRVELPPLASTPAAPEQAESLPRPCAEGMVPQPVDRHAPKRHPSWMNGSDFDAQALSYFYAGTYQYKQALGVFGNATQSAPYLATSDYHTLFEFAAQDSSRNQIVEVGWTVDRAVNGDAQPHLFVFHWINGAPQCYNGCGWVQVSATRYPGMPVAVTSTPQGYGIRYYNGNWWVHYQGEAIGYFPGSRWGGTYTQMALAQWFGEVAANASSPGTDMGTGAFGTAVDAAGVSGLYFLLSNGTTSTASLSPNVTHPSLYNVGSSTATSFKYGGPGAF